MKITFSAILVVLLPCIVVGQVGLDGSADSAGRAITSQGAHTQNDAQLRGRVRSYLGDIVLPASFDSQIAESKLAQDTLTPFIANKIHNQKVYVFRISDARISVVKGVEKVDITGTRNLEVYLDTTGALLKVVSRTPTFDAQGWVKPSADEAERQLREQKEVYLSLVDSLPPAGLDQALSAALGNPLEAGEFVALLVNYQKQGRAPVKAWIVDLYDVESINSAMASDKSSWYERGHIRSIVDATTGKLIFASNIPVPCDQSESSGR